MGVCRACWASILQSVTNDIARFTKYDKLYTWSPFGNFFFVIPGDLLVFVFGIVPKKVLKYVSLLLKCNTKLFSKP